MPGSVPRGLLRRGRPRWRGLIGALAVALALGLGGSAAAAKKKVAVFKFNGPDAEVIEQGVADVLARDHVVVQGSAFGKTLREVAPERGDIEVAIGRAARKLGADAVVAGRIKMVKGRWELEIQVRNGADGSVIESLTFELRDPDVDERTAGRMATDMADALGRARRGPPLPVEEPDEARQEKESPPERRKAAEREPEPEPAPRPKAKVEAKEPRAKTASKADDDPKAESPKRAPVSVRKEQDDEEARSDEPGAVTLAWRAAKIAPRMAEAYAGFSIVSRSFAYDNVDLQGYKSGAGPGFVVGAEGFPLQRLPLGRFARLASLGASASFALEPFGKATIGATSSPVIQRRWHFDFRYFYRLSDRAALVPALGLGQHFFSVREKRFAHPSECTTMATDLCLASAIVTYARIGADARLAIASSVIAHAGLAVLPGIKVASDIGQIASEGGDRVFGFGGELGVTVTVWRSIGVRANFEYTYLRHGLAPDTGAGPSYSSASDSYVVANLAGVFQY